MRAERVGFEVVLGLDLGEEEYLGRKDDEAEVAQDTTRPCHVLSSSFANIERFRDC